MKAQLEYGEGLVLAGKWEMAREHFEAMDHEYPENPDILNNLGVVKEATGRLRQAEDCFRRAVQCNLQHDNALMNLALLFSRTARWRQAAACSEKLTVGGGATTGCFNQMAVDYLNVADLSKAQLALEKSLALDGQQPVVEEMMRQIREKKPSSGGSDLPDFKDSFCEINITPPVSETQPVLLQGMAGQPRSATEVADPLMMQMLLLSDHNADR